MQTKNVFELLYEASQAITAEIELEKVVQKVTDIGTELAGAQFGAFFYNVINQKGESLFLYTISGVAREAFSKFPMPRNTKIFEPTFAAKGIVRYDDVTSQPHYGKNEPYKGMPHGHLPVKSYLAVPVVSPFTKEAIGGLFFGHEKAGVFTKDSEHLLEGIAKQAAIAITNARLFEEKLRNETKLREQREQYKSIFNAISDAAIIYDVDGTIVEANPTASQVYGYSYDELVGMNASSFFMQPEDFTALKEIALSGREYSGFHKRLRKNGLPIDVEFRGVRFLFRDSPHVLSVSRDVSARKQSIEILQKDETLASLITNVSPVALWMTNSEKRNIYINETWFDWVGSTSDSDSDLEWIREVLPEEREGVQLLFDEAFRNRKQFWAEFRIRRRSGELRWCISQGGPYYHYDGNFGGYAGSIVDTNDKKLVEQMLSSQNTLFNTMTNNTQQALFLMNDKQVCTFMNPAAEKMTGFTAEEVKEKPLHYYIHHTYPDGRHFPIEECPIDRALPEKAHTKGEGVFIHKDGHFFPVAFTASPIEENGVPIGTVIEVRDITEEKRIQEELRNKEKQAMQLLEQKVKERTSELEKMNFELLQFTSVASHDLKEPVRKISVYSKLMNDKMNGSLEAGTQKYLNTIIKSSDRMARLIDDLLSFSRISQHQVAFQAVDLNEVLEQVLEDLELPIKEKNAVVEIDQFPTIKGIPIQIGQLFQNLLSNSLKFAHPDRPVHVQVINQNNVEKEIDSNVRILYKDNGLGFKSDQADKIFEIFYRLHNKDQFEGTGVGLAIVKKIVELHRGTIWAEGIENEGARFFIKLPL